jgi:hypothetical protein
MRPLVHRIVSRRGRSQIAVSFPDNPELERQLREGRRADQL